MLPARWRRCLGTSGTTARGIEPAILTSRTIQDLTESSVLVQESRKMAALLLSRCPKHRLDPWLPRWDIAVNNRAPSVSRQQTPSFVPSDLRRVASTRGAETENWAATTVPSQPDLPRESRKPSNRGGGGHPIPHHKGRANHRFHRPSRMLRSFHVSKLVILNSHIEIRASDNCVYKAHHALSTS